VHYAQRIVLGLVVILASFVVLWFGSPDRMGFANPSPAFALAFVIVFAIGFILASMGVLGMKDDYPALLSGLVLYFIVGAMVAIVIYMGGTDIGSQSLVDWGDPSFWVHWIRVGGTWPLVLVQKADLFGWALLNGY
jgi:hypothetical protein